MRSPWKLLLAGLLLLGQASAATYLTGDGRLVDLELWAGDGPSEAIVVIDFNEAADDFFAFGYRWDPASGPPTGFDALQAIDAASDDFSVDATYFDLFDAWFVDQLDYLTHTSENDWLAYFNDDTAEGADWTFAMLGVSFRELMDQSFDGWVAGDPATDYDPQTFEYIGPDPRIPLAAGQDVIPEPAAIALLAAGTLALARRRRRP